jgi:hypothetical protein
MKPKPKLPVAPFDLGVYAVNQMTTDEKIALMKYISSVLNGPRFFTADEVNVFVQSAISDVLQHQKDRREQVYADNLINQMKRFGDKW